jgi:hypothetical protein
MSAVEIVALLALRKIIRRIGVNMAHMLGLGPEVQETASTDT